MKTRRRLDYFWAAKMLLILFTFQNFTPANAESFATKAISQLNPFVGEQNTISVTITLHWPLLAIG